jgi:hypothetical protein
MLKIKLIVFQLLLILYIFHSIETKETEVLEKSFSDFKEEIYHELENHVKSNGIEIENLKRQLSGNSNSF